MLQDAKQVSAVHLTRVLAGRGRSWLLRRLKTAVSIPAVGHTLASGDPINFFTKGMDLKSRLQGLGEEVSEEVYLDIMLSGLTKAPDF